MKKLRIVFTGGGSGGHIYPLIALVESLNLLSQKANIEFEFYYIGPKDEWSQKMEKKGIKVFAILAGKWRRYFSILNFLDIPKVALGFIQALFRLLILMPDLIFSKGGTGAFQVVFAGVLYRIPVFIHESDVVPGVNNLLSARFAKRVFISFSHSLQYFDPNRTHLVGAPIRTFLLIDRIDSKLAKKELGFDPNAPLLLVICGSQGASRINDFIITNLRDILEIVQVLHQTGKSNFEETAKLAAAQLNGKDRRYQASPFLEDEHLKKAYIACDVVLSRAGSNVIFEIASFGKPAILVPLPGSAADHQRGNAYEFAKFGGGIVVEEDNLLSKIFLNQLKEIIQDPLKYNAMSQASSRFYKPNAAGDIAKAIIRFLRPEATI